MSDTFGIKEVCDLSIQDYVTGQELVFVDYASATTNENKAQRLDLKGGRGHYVVQSFDHSREGTLKLDVPIVDLKMVALLAGEDLETGAHDVYQRETLASGNIAKGVISVTTAPSSAGNLTATLDGTAYTVAVLSTDTTATSATKIKNALASASGYSVSVTGTDVTVVRNKQNATITLTVTAASTGAVASVVTSTINGIILTKLPLANSLGLFELKGKRDKGDEITLGDPATSPKTYSIVDSVVTLDATQYPKGSMVVAGYFFTTSASSKKIRISANKFPKTVKIFGDGLFRDQEDDKDYPAKMQVFKAKPKADMTFTMAGDKATDLSIEFTLYPEDLSNGDKGFIEYVVVQ